MAVMQIGYDATKRNQWLGTFSNAKPPVAWAKVGFEYGAPVYVSGSTVVTVTGLWADPLNDGTYITAYNDSNGTQLWRVKAPLGDASRSGYRGPSWPIGVTDNHVYVCRATYEYTHDYNHIYALKLADGTVDWSTTMAGPIDIGAQENWQDETNLCILPNGNIIATGYRDDGNPAAVLVWMAEFDATTGVMAWEKIFPPVPISTPWPLLNPLQYQGIVVSDDKTAYTFHGRDVYASPNTAILGAYDLTNDGNYLGGIVYGPNQEGSPLITAVAVVDHGLTSTRLFASYQMFTDPALRKMRRTLVCYDIEDPNPAQLWRANLDSALGYNKVLIWPPNRPSVDVFGNVYPLDQDGLLRQYDVNGNLLHTFAEMGTHRVQAYSHDCMHDTQGKMLQIERGLSGGIRMFDLVSADPYTPKWELATAAAYLTRPCLYAGNLYVNAGGTITKYGKTAKPPVPPVEYTP